MKDSCYQAIVSVVNTAYGIPSVLAHYVVFLFIPAGGHQLRAIQKMFSGGGSPYSGGNGRSPYSGGDGPYSRADGPNSRGDGPFGYNGVGSLQQST